MYLFVFTFLVISVIGLHMQVYVLQVAKAFKNQTSMAKTMVMWHKAAEGVAERYATIGAGPTGHALVSFSIPPFVMWPAPAQNAGVDLVMKNPADDLATDAFPAQWTSTLPKGYAFEAYKWYSVAYTPAGSGRRIMTFVAPPALAKDPITQPDIGYTIGELSAQVNRLGVSKASYGVVLGGKPTPPPVVSGPMCGATEVVTTYPRLCLAAGVLVDLPDGNFVPVGSFVLITQK